MEGPLTSSWNLGSNPVEALVARLDLNSPVPGASIAFTPEMISLDCAYQLFTGVKPGRKDGRESDSLMQGQRASGRAEGDT